MLTRESGLQAEHEARRYLERQGLSFVTANYSAKVGELDIVMQDKECWVAVEVKYRSDDAFGRAVEFVTPTKMRRVRRTFEHYLLSKGYNPAHTPMRIDVVALDGQNMQWLKNVI